MAPDRRLGRGAVIGAVAAIIEPAQLLQSPGWTTGYEEFIEAIANPQHERHAEMREWCGEHFDPKTVDMQAHPSTLAALARQWARNPAVKHKKTTDLRA